MSSSSYRREHDLLGYRDVPAEAYYGIHTVHSLENFSITGTPISIIRTSSSRSPASTGSRVRE